MAAAGLLIMKYCMMVMLDKQVNAPAASVAPFAPVISHENHFRRLGACLVAAASKYPPELTASPSACISIQLSTAVLCSPHTFAVLTLCIHLAGSHARPSSHQAATLGTTRGCSHFFRVHQAGSQGPA